MSLDSRRNFFKLFPAGLASTTLFAGYNSIAAPLQKRVRITGLKAMVVRGSADWNLVKVETDVGLAGIGEAYWGRGVKDVILGYLRDVVIGQDPLDIEPLYTKMLRLTGGAGAQAGVTVTAISGVEIALWDLAGKILGLPVCKLLGGQYRQGVRAYWTRSPDNILDPVSCRRFAAELKGHPYGITAFKVDADRIPRMSDPEFREPGHDAYGRHLTHRDLDLIAAGFSNVREAVGENIGIAVHCHWEYDWIDALELARAVALVQPMWLEDPMPPGYSSSWVKLTSESPIPILTGENLYRCEGFEPFITNQACHLIQPDIPKTGGLLESKKIANLAALRYLPVCAHNAASPLGTVASAHCAASIADFRAHEFSPGRLSSEAWEQFVIYDGPVIKDGKIRILDKPGFGVELNEDHVRQNLAPGEKWWD